MVQSMFDEGLTYQRFFFFGGFFVVFLTYVCTDITTARNLLGPGKIIGISANSVDEAVTACEQGADYLGIGTIFSTQT